MAGIRGQKNPMPVKPATATGIFKQRGPAPSMDRGAMSAAYASDRMGPKARNNKLPSNTSSQRSSPGLKRGTAG